jgi:hypothetical protein
MKLSTDQLHALQPSRPLILFAVVVALVAGCAQALPPEWVGDLSHEDGPFEVASAVILALTACFGFVQWLRGPSLVKFAGAVCLTVFFLREMDFQKLFTYRSIASLGYYTRPIAPWTEKLVVLGVLGVLGIFAAIVAREAWRHWPPARHGTKAWGGTVTIALILLASGLICEKFLGFTVAEEALETGFAVMISLLAWQTLAARESGLPPSGTK